MPDVDRDLPPSPRSGRLERGAPVWWPFMAPAPTLPSDRSRLMNGGWALGCSRPLARPVRDGRSNGKKLRLHRRSGGGGVISAAFSHDGRRVLTGAANRAAVLRDSTTGQTFRKWQVGSYRITSVAISRDIRRVLTGNEGQTVKLHDVETGRIIRGWRYSASAEAVAFPPDGRQALMGVADGAAILCDIRSPERRRSTVRTTLGSNGRRW